jgi:hypothetical protein
MGRILIVLIAAPFLGIGASDSALQQGASFPHTFKNGRATVVYQHDGLTVAANYDYSQRNHERPWLLIDVALGSNTRFVLHRNNFSLVTPGGPTIRLASQAQGEADPNGINLLIQNARIHRQNLDGYFPQRKSRETLHFFSLPFDRTVSDEAIVDNDRVTMGALLFRSLDGGWKEGTYRLVLDNEKAKAELPITLQ